jgi:hypothetical protein
MNPNDYRSGGHFGELGEHDSPTARLRRMVPSGLGSTWMDMEERRNRLPASAFVARQAIPAASIRAGDIVVQTPYARGWTAEERRHVRGVLLPVPKSALTSVLEHVDALELVDSAWERRAAVEELAVGLGHHVHGRSSGPTPLAIIRPAERSDASEPVTAQSDDGAIFELLAQVGCSMPRAA